MYQRYLKRLLDLVSAFFLLVLTSPVFVVTSLILFIQNRGVVFFIQERPGQFEKAFRLIKFKTMTDNRDANGSLLPDVQRITRAGRTIRKLSIDELPQLVNVLRGDMSLIGPRPLLFKYIPLYNERQRRRHDVRPGITGWAQVNGRNAISWTRKFELDLFYVENLSLMLDLKIMFKTAWKIVKREGINQSEDRPMMPFTGNN